MEPVTDRDLRVWHMWAARTFDDGAEENAHTAPQQTQKTAADNREEKQTTK